MTSSNWSYNERLRELNAAQLWGCDSPAVYDSLDKNDRLEIVTWYEVKWRVDAINSYELQKKNKPRKKAKKRSSGPKF